MHGLGKRGRVAGGGKGGGGLEGEHDSLEVFGDKLTPQQHRGIAHSLLDDPGPLHNGRDQLEHAVPALISLIALASQESATSLPSVARSA